MTDKRRQKEETLLIEIGPPIKREPLLRRLKYPIWTEKKAKLIEEYLFLFVMITRHGTYIDGFTGPQDPDKLHTWAAKLVVERKPRWFRHFYLFETNKTKVEAIKQMVASQAPRNKKTEPHRIVEISDHDCNEGIVELLNKGCIKQKEATFCLLDQHTFECHWSTVEALARYKQGGENKIELFYFLGTSWFGRAIAATKDQERLRAWWGRDDWDQLKKLNSESCVNLVAERFRSELQYASVKAWPIRNKTDGGHVMYHMIHATDHAEAPGLMRRAYEKVVISAESSTQMDWISSAMK